MFIALAKKLMNACPTTICILVGLRQHKSSTKGTLRSLFDCCDRFVHIMLLFCYCCIYKNPGVNTRVLLRRTLGRVSHIRKLELRGDREKLKSSNSLVGMV